MTTRRDTEPSCHAISRIGASHCAHDRKDKKEVKGRRVEVGIEV